MAGSFRFSDYAGPPPPAIRIEVTIRVIPGENPAHALEVDPGSLDGGAARPLRLVGPAAADDLTDAVEAWLGVLKARGKKPGTITVYRQTIRAAARERAWRGVSQLTYDDLMAYLGAKRAGGWKGTTYNRNLTCFRSLTKYLVRAGKLAKDPLADEQRAQDDGEEGARAATLDEARAFIRAAWLRQISDKRCKGNRALYWLCLFAHGCRAGEPDKWTRGHLILDEAPPTIRWTPEINKNGRRQEIALAPELAALLRAELALQDQERAAAGLPPAGPDEPVFPFSPPRRTFREDRDRAGIAAQDRRGRPFQGHSGRKFLKTELTSRGVPTPMVEFLMRHTLTVEARYYDPPLAEQAAAVAMIPRLWPENAENLPGSKNLVKGLDPAADGGTLNQSDDHANSPEQLGQPRGPDAGRMVVADSGRRGPAGLVETTGAPAGASGPTAGLIRPPSYPRMPILGHIKGADRNSLADLFEALAGLLREPGRGEGRTKHAG